MSLPLGPVAMSIPGEVPPLARHQGGSVVLAPLTASHARELWEAAQSADASWTYLRYGSFASETDLRRHLDQIAGLPHQPFFAIIPTRSGAAEGWASFCDVSPADASIEIGSIWFSPRLQRTRAATESVFLMLRHAFAFGYQRVAWRCNALNAASMRAAVRFGFTQEGVWRAAEIIKGRHRDTAWFSMLATEWPEQQSRFEAWLADDNFDALGTARRPLQRR